jgi:hypothetical protein
MLVMNRLFLFKFKLQVHSLFFLLFFFNFYFCQSQSNLITKSDICKQFAIQSAQSADQSFVYSQKSHFEPHSASTAYNIDAAISFIKESINYLDSALILASDSAKLAIKHANIARNSAIDSYNTLLQLKNSNYNSQKKELSEKAVFYASNTTVEAYYASFYFTDKKKIKEKIEKPKVDTAEKQITKLDIDQTLFTLLKVDLNEKGEINKQEISKLTAELAKTKDLLKQEKLKSQLKDLELKKKDLEEKNKDAQQKLTAINILTEERDKSGAKTTSPRDTIFSKSITKTNDEWNKQIKSGDEIPNYLVYQVQLGVFKANVESETFKGLTPIYSKTTESGVSFTTGLFEKLSDATEARSHIQSMGLKDAFIVAYYNKKRITIAEAVKLEKK